MVLREKDSDGSGGGAWTAASDGTLEERRYYLQNWRADVSAVLDAAGDQVERVKYSAYGVPFCVTPADFNADGSVTTQDNTDFTAAYNSGTYDARCDLNLDGLIDFSDWLAWLNEYNGGEAGGRGVLSRSSNANRAGYAGYRHAPEIQGSAAGGGAKWHVRHRVLDSETGRWTRRDPLGYVDGRGLYEYVGSLPTRRVDPYGQVWWICGSSGPAQPGDPGSPECQPNLGGVDLPPRTATPPELILPSASPCDDLGVPVGCRQDSLMKAACRLYKASCGDSDPPTFVPGQGPDARYCCKDNSIRYPFSRDGGCTILAHEMVHAADNCLSKAPCGGADDCGSRPGQMGCQHVACSEARAMSLTCCDPSYFMRSGVS